MENVQHKAVLLLGSNINRHKNLPEAIARLTDHPQIDVCRVSSVYESEAVGGAGSYPAFSNAAMVIGTRLSVGELRHLLHRLEAEMGRVRSPDKFAPRPIDVDIVLYDDLVEDVGGSAIPDPDIHRFSHVAVPLAEVAPHWIHPIRKQSLYAIAAGMDRRGLRVID